MNQEIRKKKLEILVRTKKVGDVDEENKLDNMNKPNGWRIA